MAKSIVSEHDEAHHAEHHQREAELQAALERIAAWEFDINGDCVADAKALAKSVLANVRAPELELRETHDDEYPSVT